MRERLECGDAGAELSRVQSVGMRWSHMADACAIGDMANAKEAEADARGDEGAVIADTAPDARLCSWRAVSFCRPSRCGVDRFRRLLVRVLWSYGADEDEQTCVVGTRPDIGNGPGLLPLRLCAE